MLLRVFIVFFLSCLLPAHASVPPMPQKQALSLKTVFRIAQNEMPLPIVRVASWPLSAGKQRYVIEMSTASVPRAKDPIMHVSFEIPDDGNGLELALHQASALVKALVEAAAYDPRIQSVRWQPLDLPQAASETPH
jgi:hypothetical protein